MTQIAANLQTIGASGWQVVLVCRNICSSKPISPAVFALEAFFRPVKCCALMGNRV